MSATPSKFDRLCGFIPAVPTPFTPNYRIDIAAFERFCDLQIRAHATALIVCGTTGEAPTLSTDERRDLISAACRIASGRVPVIAGAGSSSTTRAIELSRLARTAGADAVLSAVPYYNKPTQAGIHAHFQAIATAVDLPIILCDVPSRTVVGLADETIVRLANLAQVVGLTDAAGDIRRLARLRARTRADFRLFCGDDAFAPAYLAQGGDGCISVTSNIAPDLCRALYNATASGDVFEVRKLCAPFLAITSTLSRPGNPVPVKYALSMLGLMPAAVRLPLVQLREGDDSELATAIRKFSTQWPGCLIEPAAGTHRGLTRETSRASCAPPPPDP